MLDVDYLIGLEGEVITMSFISLDLIVSIQVFGELNEYSQQTMVFQ